MSLKVTTIKNEFDYTSKFSTEIKFNNQNNGLNWRLAFVNIKIQSDYLEVKGQEVKSIEFKIKGNGERESLIKAFEHFAEVLKNDLDDYLKRESNDPLLRP
jgi:hypothetical protein